MSLRRLFFSSLLPFVNSGGNYSIGEGGQLQMRFPVYYKVVLNRIKIESFVNAQPILPYKFSGSLAVVVDRDRSC